MQSVLRRVVMSLMRKKFRHVGISSWISPFGSYLTPKTISIGNNVYLGQGAVISASAGLRIGDGVVIGPEFCVMAGDHNFRVVGRRIHEVTENGKNAPVVIEDDVWIGARVTLLKGVTVGEGAIVGAGSLVTRSVSPYSVAAGNPARRISARFTKEELVLHLESIGSNYRIEELEGLYGSELE